MLRRKILTSAMASVMALTSISAVAFADDAATDVKNVKTKADLEAFVKEMNSFRDKSIDDYGSISGERFENMIDFAQNILDTESSTVDDFTAAYAMLEATYNKLRIYTASELRDLVRSCTNIYDTNNIMNEEFGDAIYKDDKNQWGNFTDAYEEAESVLNSADSRIITDAYETLDDAKGKLTNLEVVTKAQFRTALKAYEKALQSEFKYDAWRRGKISDSTWSVQWAFDDSTYAWGAIYYGAASMSNAITEQYKILDDRKSVSKTTNDDIVNQYNAAKNATTVLNSFVADDSGRGSKSGIKNLIDDYRGLLVHDYATTAATDLFKAIYDLKPKTQLLVEAGDGSSFVELGAADVAADGFSPFYVQETTAGIATAASGLHPDWMGAEKTISAEITIKAADTIYLRLNENGFADIYGADGSYDASMVSAAVSASSFGNGTKQVRINKNSSKDITQYIKVDAVDVIGESDNHEKNDVYDGDSYAVNSDHWTGKSVVGSWILNYAYDGTVTTSQNRSTKTYTDLADAMKLAEFYQTAGKNDFAGQGSLVTTIYDIDTTGAIADNSAKGSSAEYTLVYRYLKYALEDKYKASTGTHTKAEVVDLIEKAYDLADATGDAAMFAYNHKSLVDARQDANAWVKAANRDKKYKDNISTYAYGAQSQATATDVYNSLNNAYNELNNDYEAFKYSFGDIFYYIAEVKQLLDDGKLEMTDAIKTGLEDVAYRLVTVESLDDEVGAILDNDIFTAEYTMNQFNRVFSKNGEYYKALDISSTERNLTVPDSSSTDNAAAHTHYLLTTAFEGLKTEVNKQLNPDAKLGDVNKDGAINAIDAALILKAAADGTVDTLDKAVADFNTDGAINALDAAGILKGVADGTLK